MRRLFCARGLWRPSAANVSKQGQDIVFLGNMGTRHFLEAEMFQTIDKYRIFAIKLFGNKLGTFWEQSGNK